MTSVRRGLRSFAAVGILAAGSVAFSQSAANAAGFGASWQFNETTGPALDSSGNGNNGTLFGGIVRTGTRYDFDGSSGYVSVPNSASLNPGSANIALRAQFSLNGNPIPSTNDYDIVRKGLSTTPGGDYKMEVLSNGQALCVFRGTRAVTVQGGTNLGNGTHTVRCVKTASAVKLIVDGRVTASANAAVGSMSNTEPVILGAKPGDDFTNGFVNYITIT